MSFSVAVDGCEQFKAVNDIGMVVAVDRLFYCDRAQKIDFCRGKVTAPGRDFRKAQENRCQIRMLRPQQLLHDRQCFPVAPRGLVQIVLLEEQFSQAQVECCSVSAARA